MWKKREIANPKRRTGIAAAIAAMAAASVFSPQVMGQAKEIKVAVVAPISGPWARPGQLIQMGAQMAVDEINAQGGIKSIGGAKLKLVVADAGDSAEKAKNAAQRLVASEPDLVGGTGAWLSSFTLAVTEVTERAQIPWITLSFADARVPVANRLGAEGEGFKIALSMLDSGRIGVGAQALGVMTAAFHEAVRYAQQRQAWGAPIARIQAVQFKLAEMERRIQAARLLLQKAAWLKDSGQDFIRAASMAKLYCTEAATWVTHQAIQVHGGYGYVKEYAVERYYRDARVMEIYEGTSEIQRLVIARSMLKDGVKA